MSNLKNDLRYPIVLRYFEALDADNWSRVAGILSVAEKDKSLEDAILKAHEGLDYESDVSLVQQVEKKLKEDEE
jgi:hypothetical protein